MRNRSTHTTGAIDGNCAEIKHPAKDALLNIEALDLVEIELNRVAADDTELGNDTLRSNGQLCVSPKDHGLCEVIHADKEQDTSETARAGAGFSEA